MVPAVVAMLIGLYFLGTDFAEKSDGGQKEGFFVESGTTVVPTIAYQPDCPLEFQSVAMLGRVGGGSTWAFRVRNRSAKNVTGYEVAGLTTGGSEIRMRAADKRMSPGESSNPYPDEDTVQIVPLTDELREKHPRGNSLLAVAVFMIVRARCSDGTLFDAESEYNALNDYLKRHKIDPGPKK